MQKENQKCIENLVSETLCTREEHQKIGFG
jgi:hypothetical protein